MFCLKIPDHDLRAVELVQLLGECRTSGLRDYGLREFTLSRGLNLTIIYILEVKLHLVLFQLPDQMYSLFVNFYRRLQVTTMKQTVPCWLIQAVLCIRTEIRWC